MEQLTAAAENGTPPVSIAWRSFELRPKHGPPISPEYRARIEASRPQLYAIARERYNLEMDPGPFGIDSRPALIGEKYAEEQGYGAAFHDAVMVAYWRDGLDISDRTVLADVAAQAGLARGDFLAALDDPTYDRQVQADVDTAQTYGLNSVPALIFADKYLVSGAQPADVLIRVVNQIAQELDQPNGA